MRSYIKNGWIYKVLLVHRVYQWYSLVLYTCLCGIKKRRNKFINKWGKKRNRQQFRCTLLIISLMETWNHKIYPANDHTLKTYIKVPLVLMHKTGNISWAMVPVTGSSNTNSLITRRILEPFNPFMSASLWAYKRWLYAIAYNNLLVPVCNTIIMWLYWN